MTNTSHSAEDQAKTLRDLNTLRPGNIQKEVDQATTVYSITSGKGGVGKTAVCANLAYNLASMGKRVLILDADLGLGVAFHDGATIFKKQQCAVRERRQPFTGRRRGR